MTDHLPRSNADVCLAMLQRVASATVTVDKQLVSSIGNGVLVFAAIAPEDSRSDADSMASKVLKLKMWPDEAGAGVLHPLAGYVTNTDMSPVEAKRARYPGRGSLR